LQHADSETVFQTDLQPDAGSELCAVLRAYRRTDEVRNLAAVSVSEHFSSLLSASLNPAGLGLLSIR
jgi:hypothetical protein